MRVLQVLGSFGWFWTAFVSCVQLAVFFVLHVGTVLRAQCVTFSNSGPGRYEDFVVAVTQRYRAGRL